MTEQQINESAEYMAKLLTANGNIDPANLEALILAQMEANIATNELHAESKPFARRYNKEVLALF